MTNDEQLHDAASRGDGKGIHLLLRYGARIDVRDKRGALPCQFVPDEMPELLLDLVPE